MIRNILASACLVAAATAADATTTVNFATSGPDSATTAGFFSLSVSSTDGQSVSSISIDLSPSAGAFFDFDGSGSFDDATAPVFSGLSGVTESDITLGFVGPASSPTELILNFAAGTFADGDSLLFGADTDSFLGGPPDPGGDFGDAGVLVNATVGGTTRSSSFTKVSDNVSVAEIEFDVQVVPLPAGLPLLMGGLAAFGLIRGARRKA